MHLPIGNEVVEYKRHRPDVGADVEHDGITGQHSVEQIHDVGLVVPLLLHDDPDDAPVLGVAGDSKRALLVEGDSQGDGAAVHFGLRSSASWAGTPNCGWGSGAVRIMTPGQRGVLHGKGEGVADKMPRRMGRTHRFTTYSARVRPAASAHATAVCALTPSKSATMTAGVVAVMWARAAGRSVDVRTPSSRSRAARAIAFTGRPGRWPGNNHRVAPAILPGLVGGWLSRSARTWSAIGAGTMSGVTPRCSCTDASVTATSSAASRLIRAGVCA